MIRSTLAAAALLATMSLAHADPIEGNWRTLSGDTARITSSGSGYVITVTTGQYSGRQVGSMTASGSGKYSGEITDPTSDKTYSGNATLSGSTLKLSGCVLGGLICKSQNWKRL